MKFKTSKITFEFLKILGFFDKNLNDFMRRIILLINDIFLLFLAPLTSFYILFEEETFLEAKNYIWIFYCLTVIGLICFYYTDLYKTISKYISSKEIYRIAFRNLIVIFLTILIGNIFNFEFPENQNLWILVWSFLTIFISLSRFTLRDTLLKIRTRYQKRIKKVVIYGAGSAGAKLARNLNLSNSYYVKFFIDDSEKLEKRKINGITIFNPNKLKHTKQEIDKIFIAIPSLQKKRRIEIVEHIQKLGIPIYSIPSLEEITDSEIDIDNIKPIKIEDLLGREPVPPDQTMLEKGVFKKSICITGAGGSIGSEICYQLIKYKPKKIILIEQSEIALYKIYENLKIKKTNIQILPVLVSCLNFNFINELIMKEQIDVIFHAAAYKHVPLVESNPIQGLLNNVFSTKNMCLVARKNKVSKFILISTDKAVRPTSVMGASKRLAELIVQAFAKDANFYSNFKKSNNQELKTCFSIVRFGNVLGSSGSVVPLFESQIKKGGPITITDPRIIRYFMTIKEAALLVIQTSVMAKGGDVFLLDMGKPVKILDLAKQMIKLSGLTEKKPDQINGDIEIKISGLRAGEKLYEELLINSESLPTNHPLIFRAQENCLDPLSLEPKLDKLEKFLIDNNIKKSFLLLKDLVEEWKKTDHKGNS